MPIRLNYLDSRPGDLPVGLRFAVPWPRATCSADDGLILRGGGREIASQSWPIATWPDGSVKWSAVSAAVDASCGDDFVLDRGDASPPANPLTCREENGAIDVGNGDLSVSVATSGSKLINHIRRGNVDVCGAVHLTCIRERLSRHGDDDQVARQRFLGRTEKATVEQSGPVSLVVRVEGAHHHAGSGDRWLPFSVRLYFHAGVEAIRLVHSFVYDGHAEQDFVAGLGVSAVAPMRDEPANRRVLLALDDSGVWSEPVCPVPFFMPRGTSIGSMALPPNPQRARQLAGEPLENPGGVDATPLWQHFKLVQDSADHFAVRKACGDRFTHIDASHGRRATGAAAIVDTQGGLGVGVRDFWQTHPSALTVDHAGEPEACITAWLWPRADDVPAMDLRHYTDRMYGPMYEAYACVNWEAGPVDPVLSNALGIARTSELTLWPLPAGAQRGDLAERARLCATPPLLVCEPRHYHDSGATGVWALRQEAPNAVLRRAEAKLDALLDHYVAEVERQRWYGFWHWGDVMHSYDRDRHKWTYDEGGYAWDNIECSTDIWLWNSFLRTGRADVFRMAEAMARHVSDVDIYHLGPLAGLGSRHNVVHWGCGCKEPRISMPGGRRTCCYLTVDDRLADVFDDVCDAWPTETTPMVFAPTWSALCWNWVTAWERTGHDAHRRKLRSGMDGVLAQEPPFISGAIFGFDPDDGSLTFTDPQEPYSLHMTLPFGSPEIFWEMADLLEDDRWAEALASYGRFWALPDAERVRLAPGTGVGEHAGLFFAARLIAWAARRDGNRKLGEQAWDIVLSEPLDLPEGRHPDTDEVVREIAALAGRGQTNIAAQWSLQVMEILELVGPPE